jgi:hypothetical protein
MAGLPGQSSRVRTHCAIVIDDENGNSSKKQENTRARRSARGRKMKKTGKYRSGAEPPD